MQWSTLQQLQQQLQPANAETRRQAVHQVRSANNAFIRDFLIVCVQDDKKPHHRLPSIFHCCSTSAHAPRTRATSDSSGSRPP